MLVGMVQKGSACAHWYAKVRTCDTVLIPTHSYNEHSTFKLSYWSGRGTIALLNFTKSIAESGLVKGMAIMSAVGEVSMYLDRLNTFPETKR